MDTEQRERFDWWDLLVEQLDWWWQHHLRPRMDGLADEEYHWEPVPGMWGIRPRGTSTAPMALGGGGFTMDFAFPEPSPPPATTIAWRMMHLVIGCFGMRAASHFGGPAVDHQSYDYPGDAATALERLDASYALWTDGVRGLGRAGMLAPIGPAGGALYADEPMASLVAHINREVLHHGAEIALLRDLYQWKER
jgi:hypothetical protein